MNFLETFKQNKKLKIKKDTKSKFYFSYHVKSFQVVIYFRWEPTIFNTRIRREISIAYCTVFQHKKIVLQGKNFSKKLVGQILFQIWYSCRRRQTVGLPICSETKNKRKKFKSAMESNKFITSVVKNS